MIVVLAGVAAPWPEAHSDEPPATSHETSGASLLKSKNLTRSGTKYVLEEAEKDVQDKLKSAKDAYGQYQKALNNQSNEQEIQAQLSDLAVQKMATQQMIGQLQMQANSLSTGGMGTRGSRAMSYQRQGVNNMVNQQRQILNSLGQQESLLKSQLPNEKQRAESRAEVERQKTELTDRLKELQTAVDSGEEKYGEVAKDKEIQGALNDLGRAARVNFKLGPSDQFLAAVKYLKAANQATKGTPAKSSKSAAKKKKAAR